MSEKTGEVGIRLEYVYDGTPPNWDEMIRHIDKVATQYGCKVRQYGPWSLMKQAATEEAEFIDTITRHISHMRENVSGTNWVVLGDKEAE